MLKLYPPIEPYKTEIFPVSDVHSLYLEQSGNPDGIPIIELHGGPGSRSKQDHRQFYDPEKYRIIFFDQRGCGKSTPFGELKKNTTWDLVEDMEKIRKHLHIEKWVVTGGSWGSTLALAYAEAHPEHVSRLILRSIFLCREQELEAFFSSDRFSAVYPDVWEQYVGFIPKEEQNSLTEAYKKRIHGNDKVIQKKAIQLISYWNTVRQQHIPKEKSIDDIKVDDKALGGWMIFFYYLENKMFLKENQLINNIGRIRHIPTVIIHGRYDMCCPLQTAWDLHKAFPEADFQIVQEGSHRVSETGFSVKLMEYTNII